MTGPASQLDSLRQAGVLSALDLQVARALSRLVAEQDPLVLLGAALASRAPHCGHVCVELARPLRIDASTGLPPDWSWPDPEAWAAALSKSLLVGDGQQPTPLVLDSAGRLYLRRYWQYQELLAERIRERAGSLVPDIDFTLLGTCLRRLFPLSDGPDLQKQAALSAALRRFCVISGGPGTGKTTTVLKVLVLLLQHARARGRFPLRIALVAPTGKAAARLAESLRTNLPSLEVEPEVRAAIPEHSQTIHRCLGYQARTPTQFRHNAATPLAVDVLVCDESSMVDLALMAKLVDAVPPGARLILLGDRDQLSSVEAGAILGDLCNTGHSPRGYSRAFADSIRQITGEDPPARGAPEREPGIWDCMVQLDKSWRFDPHSGIGALAQAINGGDGAAARALLGQNRAQTPGRALGWIPLEETSDEAELLAARLVAGFGAYLRETDPAQALQAFGRFGVLCAHRRGPFGVERLNRLARQSLARAGLVLPTGTWYPGRPVMITRNDHQAGLFNGDVGLTLPDPERPEQLKVHFPSDDGCGTRTFHVASLPEHQTVYAMTIHKSQGSEFNQVLLLLPPRASPILTRELLYTGVTRARERIVVAGSPAIIEQAVQRRVQRASGLRDALWGAD